MPTKRLSDGNKKSPQRSPQKRVEDNDGPTSQNIDEELTLSDDEEGGIRVGDIYIPPPVKPYCSSESKGPRLIISNIVIENFKSYAGKVELGPFHQCISAVIGPNGSGKSNVIDAMLFVFGYRAQKLRLKKLSALIHNSAKATKINSCTVYVHFKQIEDTTNDVYNEVPGTEFIVSRTAFHDNSSYYSINDRRTNFKEVAKMLKDNAIDLQHNRFLILQGEVESIAMMKPKALTPSECGLLEYLEDIIGTSRYKEPLEKIFAVLEVLNEERTQKHNRCKLAEREMKDLEQPMEEAVEYLNKENQLTRIHNTQYQKKIFDLRQKLKKFEEKFEQFDVELKEHDKGIEEIRQKRIEKENFIKEETTKRNNLTKQIDDYDGLYRNAVSKSSQLHSSLQITNKHRKQTMVQLEKEEKNLIDFHEIPKKNEKTIEDAKKRIEQFAKKKAEQEEILEKNLSNLREETKDLTEEREKLQSELLGLKKTETETKSELTVAESELQVFQMDQTNEFKRVAELEEQLANCKEQFSDATAELATKETESLEMRKRLEKNTVDFKRMQEEEVQLSAKLKQLEGTLDEVVNAQQASKSQNKVLNALMAQKQKGNIPGILGRLGDLGAIDEKYDVAISTCCGRLDNIVVDKVTTGQKAISFLKDNNVGRASFIALDKMHPARSIQTPENAPRLYDLIRVEDERVLPAFYFALRDTLVADNLAQATRIAYGARRFRVVTLMGEVIEISGTMSGGGRSLMRGRMSNQVKTKTVEDPAHSRQNIEKMQIQAQEIRENINYIQEQRGPLSREIQELRQQLAPHDNRIKKIQIEIKSLNTRIPKLEEKLTHQISVAESVRIDPERVKQLEKSVAAKRSIFDNAEKNAKKISLKVDTITKQINEITEKKVKHYQIEVKKLGKEIEKLNEAISTLTVEIRTAQRNIKKSETKIENYKSEIEEAQNKIRTESAERTEIEKDVVTLNEKIAEVKKLVEEVQAGFSDTKKEIDALQKQEDTANMKRLEIEEKLKSVKKEVSETKSQVPQWEKQLKPLTLHAIPRAKEPEEPLKVYTDEELEKQNDNDLRYQKTQLEEMLQNKPNLSVIQEYEKSLQNYLGRVANLEEITTKRNKMRELYEDVRKNRFNEFMHGFQIISKKLKEIYQTITMGGDAELELIDSMDPFNEGICFSVRPPKKSWKQISHLSGGEKTLSSLALVFALHYFKPSPLYVMDEIDAALDFKNVSIVAQYIKERARNAQFIIISLRSNMFELAEVLVGIFKVKDCSASVAIQNVPVLSMYSNQDPGDRISSGTQKTSMPLSQSQVTQAENADVMTAVATALANDGIPIINDSMRPMNYLREDSLIEEMDIDDIENIVPA